MKYFKLDQWQIYCLFFILIIFTFFLNHYIPALSSLPLYGVVLADFLTGERYYNQKSFELSQKAFLEKALNGQKQLLQELVSNAKKEMVYATVWLGSIYGYNKKKQFNDFKKAITNIPDCTFNQDKTKINFKEDDREILKLYLMPNGVFISQWLDLAEYGFLFFQELVENRVSSLIDIFKEEDITKEECREKISNTIEETYSFLHKNYSMVSRGRILLKFLSKLVFIASTHSYKGLQDIQQFLSKSKEGKKLLYDISECFKMLYGFYKEENEPKVLYSYATFEGKRIKLSQNSQEAVWLEKDFKNQPPTVIQTDLALTEFYVFQGQDRFFLGDILTRIVNQKFFSEEDKPLHQAREIWEAW